MWEAGAFDAVIDMFCFRSEAAASAVRALRGRTGQYVICRPADGHTKPAAVSPPPPADEPPPPQTLEHGVHAPVDKRPVLGIPVPLVEPPV